MVAKTLVRKRKKKPGRYKRKGRFRSGLEADIAMQLTAQGALWKYEIQKYKYWLTGGRNRAFCGDCHSTNVLSEHDYTPDFFLANGVIIEVKGRLLTTDRRKMEAMRKYYPDLDLRMLFQYDRIMNKRSKKRYSDWANATGIPWAVTTVPKEWCLHADQDFGQNWHNNIFPKLEVTFDEN